MINEPKVWQHAPVMFMKNRTRLKKRIKERTVEMKALEDALVKLETDLKKNVSDMNEIEKRIEKSTQELYYLIINNRNYRYSFLWGLFRFNQCYNDAAILAKQAELNRLVSEKDSLRNQEWNIKIQQTDLQLKLANSLIQLGAIPDPVHLKEVQKSLDRIRQILVDLKKFWKKVAVMLEALKDKTFVEDALTDELEDMKEQFLQSIEDAKQDWQRFDECCQRAQGIFSIQSRTAYKFLEINPFSLSKDEWNKQYESIMAKLRKINPEGLTTAAITE